MKPPRRGKDDGAFRVLERMQAGSAKRKMLAVVLIWMTIVGGSFLWNYSAARAARKEIALDAARSFFEEIVLTRRWNAEHGGVYVPVTRFTRPNPYLEDPMRDITVSEDLTLTKINPAYMTRQISEIAATEKETTFHITSLMPIRPENGPTPIERSALETFQRGEKEVGEFIVKGGKTHFFYMAPLITEKSCLKCHAKQGYREGNIRGGISVTIPFNLKIPLLTLLTGYLAVGLAGIAGILLGGARIESYTNQLRRQSVIDELTGIPNRRSFSQTLLSEFRRARRGRTPLSLIMCDIDNFKAYNDRYGHAAGDGCLVKTAGTIAKALNRAGDFCARYGGEEFVVILPNTPLMGALHVAGSIRAAVEALGIAHEASPSGKIVTLSLGVATLEEAMALPQELIERADEALYRAKEGGRNRAEVYRID